MNSDTMFNRIVVQGINSEFFKVRYNNIIVAAKNNDCKIEDYGLELVTGLQDTIESEYFSNPIYPVLSFSIGYYKPDFYNTCIDMLALFLKLDVNLLRSGSDSYMF